MAKMFTFLMILDLVFGDKYTKHFRFDYKFNEEAGGWLKYHMMPTTWSESRMQCHAEGAVLASPLTNELKAEIVNFVKKQPNMNNMEEITIFTGVHATCSKGVYTSIEGVPLLRLQITWAPGEPDNYENSESCLVMMVRDNGTMADASCERVLPYVCYKETTNLLVTECGTTDHEYVMNHATGSCYKFHSEQLSWSEAYKTCEAEGAYLAIINSDVEAEIVKNILINHRSSTVSQYPTDHSIGFYDWGVHRNFMTIHGQSLTEAGFENWNVGQPNNLTRTGTEDYGQRCGSFSNNGRFNDFFCNYPIVFLCEMKPNSLR